MSSGTKLLAFVSYVGWTEKLGPEGSVWGAGAGSRAGGSTGGRNKGGLESIGSNG
jgi:hypothetical protein